MPRSLSEHRSSAGFSLIELLVVLVMLGVMAGVAAPSIGRYLESLDFKKQTGKIMAVLRFARMKAVTEARPVWLSRGEDENSFSFSGAINGVRDLGLGFDDQLVMDPEEIVFYPEGYATPGTISFTKGDRGQTIKIDPLSGLPMLDYGDDK